MSKKPNRTCAVCGKEYYYCNTCGHKDPAWKGAYCSEECRDLLPLCVSYNQGRISKEDAKKIIKQMNLEDYNSYVPSVAKILKEVTAEPRIVLELPPKLDIETD